MAEDPSVPDAVLERHLERAAVQGLHMAAAATGRSPMAAIEGVTLARLEPLLAEVNAALAATLAARRRALAARLTVALVNTPTRLVVAGAPAALDALHARLAEVADARGRRAPRRAARRRPLALHVVAARGRRAVPLARPRRPASSVSPPGSASESTLVLGAVARRRR